MLFRTQDGLAEWIAPASPSSALLGFGLRYLQNCLFRASILASASAPLAPK